MKAALLVAPERIEVSEIDSPRPMRGEVEIAVGGVGLCGSDMSVFTGRWSTPATPWIMGHEAFGTVISVGEGVPTTRVGQTVVVEPNVACQACDACLAGFTSACAMRQSVGMNRQGALAERLVVPSQFAWPVTGLGPADLVCIEPSAVIHAALRRLGEEHRDSALVVGAGAQGLLMTLALVGRGTEVEVLDVAHARVEHAVALGAQDGAATRGTHALVVDTVGSPASLRSAFDRLKVGGTLLVLGLDGRPIDVTAQEIVRRQAVIRGSLTYDHPADFETTVERVQSGRFRPGRIVTDVFGLADSQAAFERSPLAAGKTWIRIGAAIPDA